MPQSSYNGIKKYAAFLFMVFTVLSGSSDGFDADSCVKAGRKAFIDIFASNILSIQDSRITINKPEAGDSGSRAEGLRDLLDTCMEASGPEYIQVCSATPVIPVFYPADLISRNNIWKSAVF